MIYHENNILISFQNKQDLCLPEVFLGMYMGLNLQSLFETVKPLSRFFYLEVEN